MLVGQIQDRAHYQRPSRAVYVVVRQDVQPTVGCRQIGNLVAKRSFPLVP
ncbi:hypothetical protein [Streptomyces sp. 35G-GA-8]|nr:hypothetical protein [Streptomyces sp. 35G-GA-8]MCL7381290.1 hypothetical protein [Streptomyces sp. 35G-GA-8]